MPGLSGAADEARDCLEDTLVTYIHTYFKRKQISYRIQIHNDKAWFVLEGIDQDENFLIGT